jgi:hypothetical protein
MKIGNPLISTELSGKLGGIVGATARGGVAYFRRRVTGSNPNTTAQNTARAVMSLLSSNWRNVLTNAQRASWASKAGSNESGIDVYMRGNFQQLYTGTAASVATAPTSVALDDTPIAACDTYDISDTELQFSELTGVDMAWAIYLTKPQSSSRLSRENPFVLVTTQSAGETNVIVSPTTGILAGITAGQVFYARFVAFGNVAPKLGRVGQEQIFRVTAQA